MKILVICGSRRKESQTRLMTDMAYEYAKSKYNDAHYLDLGKDDLEPFAGFEAQYGAKTKKLVKRVESADVFIVGSPIYDAVFSSGIKNLFEFLNYKGLEGRPAGIILKSSSPASHQLVKNQLVALFHYFNMVVNPRGVFASDADFDGKGIKNAAIKERIERLVDETVKMKK